MLFENIFLIADIIGIFAFALSGFSVGVKKNLDLLGVVLAATFTALGGGLIRDSLVLREPFAFTEIYPALTVAFAIVVALVLRFYGRDNIENRKLFIVFDALGLISFSITGSLVALASGYNLFGVIFLGFITAIGGGIVRDVLINEVPFVLKSDFYGSVAIVCALCIYILDSFNALDNYTLVICGGVFLSLRLVAYFMGWRLPRL